MIKYMRLSRVVYAYREGLGVDFPSLSGVINNFADAITVRGANR